MIEVCTVNGANEVGRNMFAVKVDNTAVIFDMGLQMENYIKITEDDDIEFVDPQILKAGKAIPQTKPIQKWNEQIKGIFISHAHLDHIGAVEFLAREFNCPIYGTEFTMAVLKKILKDHRINLKNKIIPIKPNTEINFQGMKVEFINVTHSTPQTSIIALKTKYGDIVYANDFKLDPKPLLGEPTNVKALKKLNVKLLLQDSLYAHHPGRTGREAKVKKELEELFQELKKEKGKILITTFSSHIERLTTIIKAAKILGREPLILGRSLLKYCEAAEETKVHSFKNIEKVKYGSQIRRKIFNLKNPEKYLLITTGHQGEENATLSKLVNKYKFIKKNDTVIFSCRVIPTKTTIEARRKLEQIMKEKKIRIYKDIHVSGHAYAEDIKDFLNYTKPEYVIPVHSELERMKQFEKLTSSKTKTLLMNPGEFKTIQ